MRQGVLAAAAGALLSCLIAACSSDVSSGESRAADVNLQRLQAEGNMIVDAQGRQVILRGLNHIGLRSNRLRPPVRQPDGSFTPHEELFDLQDLRDEDFDAIAAMGFNVIRTVFTWEFSQPDPPPAPYNEAYFERIDRFLDQAAERGIYVIFNFGQFGWSRAAGGNAGAPDWTVSDTCAQMPQLPGAPPQIPGGCSFFNFWANQSAPGHPIQDEYIRLWQEVARRWGDHPAVVIYDLLNEPYGGPIPPGVFEPVYLYPFYRRAAGAIREIDADTVIGFQPSLFHSVGIPTPFALPINIPNAVYLPHEYTAAYFLQRVDPSYPPSQSLLTRLYFETADDEARTFGTPWLTGETGWTRSTEADGVGGPIDAVDEEAPRLFARDLNRITNDLKVGWVWFAYSSIDLAYGINFNGELDEPLITAMAQPFPRATAGRLTSIDFDPDTRHYRQVTAQRFDAESEIALPLRWQYPDGVCIHGDGVLLAELGPDGSLLSAPSPGPCFDHRRQVLVHPALPETLEFRPRDGGCA